MIARLAIWTLIAALVAGTARAVPPPLSQGETLYVPVYSHLLHGNLDSRGNGARVLLSSMLSIRNTDPGHAIPHTQPARHVSEHPLTMSPV